MVQPMEVFLPKAANAELACTLGSNPNHASGAGDNRASIDVERASLALQRRKRKDRPAAKFRGIVLAAGHAGEAIATVGRHGVASGDGRGLGPAGLRHRHLLTDAWRSNANAPADAGGNCVVKVGLASSNAEASADAKIGLGSLDRFFELINQFFV